RIDARGVFDVIRRHTFVADRREVRGVARIVAADHDHQVDRVRDQLQHGVLTFLSCRTDGVEGAEVFGQGGLAVTLHHALRDLSGNRERFTGQHRGLIGDAHAHEIPVRVEAGGHRARKLVDQRLVVAPPFDVIAEQAGLAHVTDHDVAPTRILGHLARGGLGLFVIGLAMNQRGEAVLGIRLDPLPDVEHRSAGRIHQHAPQVAEALEVFHSHAERGHEHDVSCNDVREIEFSALGTVEKLHAHGTELGVDVGIVDDLADQEDPRVGELGAGLVGVFDRAVDAVTEAEFTSEAEGQVADGKAEALRTYVIYDAAVVIRGQGAFDGPFEPETLPKVRLLHSPNLTGQLPRRARRPSSAESASHLPSWPGCRKAWRPPTRAPGRASAARTTVPTCCWGWSFPRDRPAE